VDKVSQKQFFDHEFYVGANSNCGKAVGIVI